MSMLQEMRGMKDPWKFAALGVGGTLVAQYVGPVAIASGWVAPACGALILAGAVCVVAWDYVRTAPGDEPGPGAEPFVDPDAPAWRMAAKPSEWIEEAGIANVPDGEIEGFVRARLVENLTPLAAVGKGSWEPRLPEPIALLGLAFASRAASGGEGRRDVGSAILAGLRQAHRLPAGRSRDEALARVRSSIPVDLGHEGPLAHAYRLALVRHGMRETFLMAMLDEGRKRAGVLASAEFVWLKGVDRSLWYALNGLGRQHMPIESLAAMSHYGVERLAGRAIPEPRVLTAVEVVSALCREHRDRRVAG